MAAFSGPPPPKTLLGRHRVFSANAGVRVSPLCLGAMNFGDAWKAWMGECNKETTFKLLDEFWDMGGNFIDTANIYQAEESEEWLGEWMESRGNREEMVIATKYTNFYPFGANPKLRSNFVGNHTKSMNASLEASLRKLKTNYIDLFYVHWWDSTVSIPELMQSLNHLVAAGKVQYLGASDMPAWVVAKANEYARQSHLRGFSVYQGRWSAAFRDLEREIIPMCRDEGMAIAPWGSLGGGEFKLQKDEEGRQVRPSKDKELLHNIVQVLDRIAQRRNTALTSIALAYVRSKYAYVYPIVGGRKVEHLKGNVDALSIQLTDQEVEEIDSAASFDVGFPHNISEFIDPNWKYSVKHEPGTHLGVQVGGPIEDATEKQPPVPAK